MTIRVEQPAADQRAGALYDGCVVDAGAHRRIQQRDRVTAIEALRGTPELVGRRLRRAAALLVALQLRPAPL